LPVTISPPGYNQLPAKFISLLPKNANPALSILKDYVNENRRNRSGFDFSVINKASI